LAIAKNGAGNCILITKTNTGSGDCLNLSNSGTGPDVRITKANGQEFLMQTASELKSAMSGATVTCTGLIPAGSLVLGVCVRVNTLITGASAFTIGDGTTVDRWGTGIAVAAGTVTSGADFAVATTAPKYYPAATNVVLTATTSNFTAGAVRVTVYYMGMGGGTS
jgi:hypothetical protein